MTNIISITAARNQLYKLVDNTAASHEPIFIMGKRHDAVLISAEDWRAIQETLYLLSIPGMRESLTETKQAPDQEFNEELDW